MTNIEKRSGDVFGSTRSISFQNVIGYIFIQNNFFSM
jgi:hypothetical protein